MAFLTVRSAENITPFWERFPRFFLFPLNSWGLKRIVVFSIVAGFLVYRDWTFVLIPVFCIINALLARNKGAYFSTGVVGLIWFKLPAGISLASIGGSIAVGSALVWMYFLRHACRVLSETSYGRLDPSGYEQGEDLGEIPVKLFFLLVIFSVFVAIFSLRFGYSAGFLGGLIFNIVLPAMLMVLVVSQSLRTALNPSAVLHLITSMGRAYLLLFICIECLSSAAGLVCSQIVSFWVEPLFVKLNELISALQAALALHAPKNADLAAAALKSYAAGLPSKLFFPVVLIQAVAMYFTLVAFNMMGYAIYQFHDVLGLDVDKRDEASGSGELLIVDGQAHEIEALIEEGKIDEALELSYEAQRLHPDDPEVQERYSRLLYLAGKDDRLPVHTERLIPLLLKHDGKQTALEAWRRCREKHPDYRPEDPGACLRLAEAARADKRPKQAFDLINGFDKRFRGHALIPDVYFFCGLLLSEDMRKDDKADVFFATLCARYPDHPRAEDAKRLRKLIAATKA